MESAGLIGEPLKDGIWMAMRRRCGRESHEEMVVEPVAPSFDRHQRFPTVDK